MSADKYWLQREAEIPYRLRAGGYRTMFAVMNPGSYGWVRAGLWLLFCGAGTATAMPTMSLGTTAAAPGTTDSVPVSVTIDTNVVSFQFDLLYAANDLTPGLPVGGNALADQQLASAVVAPGVFRVLGFSFSNSPLTNGVLVYVPFAIAGDAPDHDESLVLSNMLLVNAQALVVPVSVNSNAILSVTVPPRFNAIFPANTGAMHLELTGTTGRVYVVQATTNLIAPQWMPLATSVDITGVLSADDPTAGNFPRRFYRAQFQR